MTDREKIEQIISRMEDGYDFNPSSIEESQLIFDMKYLVNCAMGLLKNNEELRKNNKTCRTNNRELRKRNKHYRETLSFYSKESNYDGYLTAGGWVKTPINDDNGEKARQALEESE